jgi:hypothetical protein
VAPLCLISQIGGDNRQMVCGVWTRVKASSPKIRSEITASKLELRNFDAEPTNLSPGSVVKHGVRALFLTLDGPFGPGASGSTFLIISHPSSSP